MAFGCDLYYNYQYHSYNGYGCDSSYNGWYNANYQRCCSKGWTEFASVILAIALAILVIVILKLIVNAWSRR